jgi:hypothetical protein
MATVDPQSRGAPGVRPNRPRDGLRRAFLADVAAAQLPGGPGDERVVTDADLAHLDEAVQRYLRFMGVVDRPRTWSFQVRFTGRFRMHPGGAWMPARAWQYNTALDVGRVFTMRLRVGHLVPMIGHDTYVRGHGRMLGNVLGLFTVADGSGEEFDSGELSTYLNDAVLLAPSMLLGPQTTWTGIDDSTFTVALRDAGREVSAQVSLDPRGAPVDFVTSDRWAALPGGPVRAPWRTPVSRWDPIDGLPFPGPASAAWDLADGPFPYIDGAFERGSLVRNLPPPNTGRR